MKWQSSHLLTSIQRAINSTPPPPKPRRTTARKKPIVQKPAAREPGFPSLDSFVFLVTPLLEGRQAGEEEYARFRQFAAAHPATPWNHLLPAWCADENNRAFDIRSAIDHASPEPEPTVEPEPDGKDGPLVSAVTGLLVPQWQHPTLPPGSRALFKHEVPTRGKACFVRIGDTWHPAEIVGMNADRRLSVVAANSVHHGLQPHRVRMLAADDLGNTVLPVDFVGLEPTVEIQPVAVLTTEEGEFADLPDWLRELDDAG